VATAPTNAQFMSNPNALLVRGTYLRCVLETRIITDIPGFTSCILTEPVYSVNGRQLLLPKGSKILGQYTQGDDGIARVAVVWDRIITPTGIDVTMSSPGVDGLGGAGHPGDYNAHWASKITSALLISLISDAFQWGAAEHGPTSSTTYAGPGGTTVVEQPFQSATARSMERLANQALQKSAARPGTVTINQGSVVNVYVTQDVDFSSVLAVR
jgi:type IV secretion system protein VirB10